MAWVDFMGKKLIGLYLPQKYLPARTNLFYPDQLFFINSSHKISSNLREDAGR